MTDETVHRFILWSDQIGTYTRRVGDRDAAVAWCQENLDPEESGAQYIEYRGEEEVGWVEEIAGWEYESDEDEEGPCWQEGAYLCGKHAKAWPCES